MKYINLSTDLPLSTLERNFKKADYYPDEKFGIWDIEKFDSNEPGVHFSYNPDNKKMCGYFIDGEDHKDFIASINNVFTGKIVEKNGKLSIRGFVTMAPIFNITVLLAIIGIVGSFVFLNNNPNVAIIGVLFVVYFIFVKKNYRSNCNKIVIFLGGCTYKKVKKNNPNKKNGKYARKTM